MANQFPPSPFNSTAVHERVALITGGGSGIGFEIARQLGLHGASVCLMGRRKTVLKIAVENLKSQGISAAYAQGDVRVFKSCVAAVKATVKHFKKLDILVNCAAGNFLAPAENISPNGFRSVMEIDTFGTFHCSQAAFSELKTAYKQTGDACIINITAKYEVPPFFQTHAAAAKMAINSLTRSMGLEWCDYGIRVIGIAPGPIAGTTGMEKLGGSDYNSMFPKNAPRCLKAGWTWDIAMTTVFCCSVAGGYITGETITVDGGGHLRTGAFGTGMANQTSKLNAYRKAVTQISRKREKENRKTPVGIAGNKSSQKSKL